MNLDADNVVFLEHLADELFHEDPDTLINRLLRQERKRMNLPEWHTGMDFLDQLIEDFAHRQIPAAG
jgi:hypothetical protein